MSERAIRADLRWLARVPVDPMTYRSLGYLLLSIPLALGYLMILTMGLALSLGLSVLIVGPVVFAATLVAVIALARFDGVLTDALLGTEVEATFPSSESLRTFARELFLGRDTWFGLLFLCWKIALGFVAFILLTVGVAVAVGLLFTPLYYGDHVVVNYVAGSWTVDSPGRAALAGGLGVAISYVLLLTVNALGFLSRAIAEGMLGE